MTLTDYSDWFFPYQCLYKVIMNSLASLFFLEFYSDLKKSRSSVRSWYLSGMTPCNSVDCRTATPGKYGLGNRLKSKLLIKVSEIKNTFTLLGYYAPFFLTWISEILNALENFNKVSIHLRYHYKYFICITNWKNYFVLFFKISDKYGFKSSHKKERILLSPRIFQVISMSIVFYITFLCSAMPQMGLIWSFKRYMILAVFIFCFMFFSEYFWEKGRLQD